MVVIGRMLIKKFKLMKMKRIILGLFVLFTIISCKKNQIESSNFESKVTMSNSGYLQFKDIQSFKSTIEELKKMNKKQLIDWEIKTGIKSLRAYFAELREADSEELNPVEEPYFAAVINQDGVFSIGSEIHVITFKTEYLIQNNNEIELQNVLNKKITLSANLKSYTIQRRNLGELTNQLKNNSLSSTKTIGGGLNTIMWSGDKTVIEPECGNGGRPERVKLMAFVNNYASYGIIGVKILGEAYRKGGLFGSRAWRSDETYYGKIEGVADFTYAGGLFNIPFSVEEYNNEDIRKTIYDYYTTPFYSNINANYIDATFTYQKNGVCPITTKFINYQ